MREEVGFSDASTTKTQINITDAYLTFLKWGTKNLIEEFEYFFNFMNHKRVTKKKRNRADVV